MHFICVVDLVEDLATKSLRSSGIGYTFEPAYLSVRDLFVDEGPIC